MTTPPKLVTRPSGDSPREVRNQRLIGGGPDAVTGPNTQDGEGCRQPGRLVHRPPAELRPHPIYQELFGAIAATQVSRVARQAGAVLEPLLTTPDGTILDGRVRWQMAINRRLPSLDCIEYDLTEEEALELLLARHHKSEGLNGFCRILVALRLEPYYRAAASRPPQAGSANTRSSNLTNNDRT